MISGGRRDSMPPFVQKTDQICLLVTTLERSYVLASYSAVSLEQPRNHQNFEGVSAREHGLLELLREEDN